MHSRNNDVRLFSMKTIPREEFSSVDSPLVRAMYEKYLEEYPDDRSLGTPIEYLPTVSVRKGNGIAVIFPMLLMYAKTLEDNGVDTVPESFASDVMALFHLYDCIHDFMRDSDATIKNGKQALRIGDSGASRITSSMITTGLFADTDNTNELFAILNHLSHMDCAIGVIDSAYEGVLDVLSSKDVPAIMAILSLRDSTALNGLVNTDCFSYAAFKLLSDREDVMTGIRSLNMDCFLGLKLVSHSISHRKDRHSYGLVRCMVKSRKLSADSLYDIMLPVCRSLESVCNQTVSDTRADTFNHLVLASYEVLESLVPYVLVFDDESIPVFVSWLASSMMSSRFLPMLINECKDNHPLPYLSCNAMRMIYCELDASQLNEPPSFEDRKDVSIEPMHMSNTMLSKLRHMEWDTWLKYIIVMTVLNPMLVRGLRIDGFSHRATYVTDELSKKEADEYRAKAVSGIAVAMDTVIALDSTPATINVRLTWLIEAS